jgi:acyl-CoA thioesterase I
VGIIVSRIGRSCPRALALLAVLAMVAACERGGEQQVAAASPSPSVSPSRSPPPSPSPDAGATRIAFLGDSITAGYGVAAPDAFPAVVEALLREHGRAVEIVNAGVSGDTSAGGLERLDWVLRSDPDVLVLELGANDALRGQPLPGIEDNLRAIVARAREHGAQVLLLGMDIPTSYGPAYTREFAQLYERLAREEAVAIVPQFIREVGADPALMQPDGLHPTVEGHRRLAELLAPTLSDLIEHARKARSP